MAVVWSCLVVSVDRLSGFVLFRLIPSVVARLLHDPDSPRRCVNVQNGDQKATRAEAIKCRQTRHGLQRFGHECYDALKGGDVEIRTPLTDLKNYISYAIT